MRVLSLFDGMACGMIALLNAGVNVESYDAYEIDKFAIQTATHNFPMIREHGDVFNADFTIYRGIDWLIGGSPCTHWSIAQTVNRETSVKRDEKGDILLHSSGIGFELFSQYLRAIDEAQPRFFIYENNKSMSADIRAAITECFGFEPVGINSALLSAQNRQRLYWVGKRNADGTYSKVNVEQPKDRGILLKDVLDSAVAMREKAHAVIASTGRTTEREFFTKNQGNMVVEPVNVTQDGKAKTISASYAYKGDGEGSLKSELFPDNPIKQTSNYVAEPVQIGRMPREDGIVTDSKQYRVYDVDGKAVTQCGQGGGLGAKTGLYALPVDEPMRVREATKAGETQIEMGACVDMTQPNSKTRRGRLMGEKSNCLVTSPQYYQYCAKLCYAVPCEWDENGYPVKAVSCSVGKAYPVYKVENGQITIKGKQYPIKLVDGYYIIRKLTASECKRLQTVPEWYEFPVSNTQAYKMLGNGWTCDVITHLINACLDGKVDEQLEQLSWF